jgi:hypothetical protein|tara:strand:- start:15 stop:413 length:399 start_codon:yes stop_codon:yes gene_type:complete
MESVRLQAASQLWMKAKETERKAVQDRRDLEDKMRELLKVDDTVDGTTRVIDGDLSVKITTRLNRKIDSGKLQDLAAEHGLSDHLSTLFRWKPELDMKSWRNADESITKPLLDAITTTPSRPSFAITNTKEK